MSRGSSESGDLGGGGEGVSMSVPGLVNVHV
jgi:hypothetical protein